MPQDNIGIKFTTIGGQAALAQSASIAKAMEGINIQQMKLVRSQTTASGITRTYQTSQQRLVTSTQKAGEAQAKYTKVVKDTTLAKKGLFGQTQSVLSAIGKVATWTVATGAVFGLFRAVGGLVTTLMEFENAMARVTTVTRGGEEALLSVRDAVKKYGAATSAALVDVGKAAYYLGSAGLTAAEQVAGLEHVMNLTVGTMGVVDQVARLVAGAYNVFGQNMEDAITASEKMQQISDLLAYTYSCYTPDTEVLTDKGWKLFTELDKTEKIASLNPKTKELEYQKPHTYVNQHFEGKLCHLKGRFADIQITPTHKLYTQVGHKPVKKEYVLVEAKDVFGRAKKFYRGCKWRGRTPKYFILPAVENNTGDGKAKKIPIKTWVRFLAWYLSEGHCVWTNKNGKPIYCITISQSEKSAYYQDLHEVMNMMPFKATLNKTSKRVGGFSITNKQLCAYLRQFGKAKEKHIPDFIKGLSKNLLRLFIKTYAYGDGSREKEKWAINIFTASNKMKDDLQEIALKADYGCTVGWRKGEEKIIKGIKTKSIGSWGISFAERTEFMMNNKKNKYYANKENRISESVEEWVDYKGNVVCVEVPNHVIFIRRNGKSFWCGNTQQVELSEIASAMGLVGSVAGLIDMPLNVLVGTLGELNSSLLKGTRAGTCYDEETEVLTKDGFKFWKDVTMEDVFATLNPKTHEMEYHKPNKIIRERYEGKMYHAVNRFLNLCVTPNHWMYTRHGDVYEKYPYKIKQAKDIFGKRETYMRGAKWEGKELEYFVLPSIISNHGKNKKHTEKKEIFIPIKTYLKFIGFYLSEGNLGKYTYKRGCSYYRILIAQTKKDKSKFKKIEKCLNKMPFKFVYRQNQFAGHGQQLYEYLKKFGKANDKYVPQFIKDLSPKLLRIFLEAYRVGDGDKKGRIVTASIKMRDDLEEVALKAGYGVQHHILRKKGEISRPTWSEKTKRNVFCPTSDIWQINICKTVEFSFNQKRNVKLAKKKNYISRTKEEWVDYKGMVYCCNVTNHIVFVRRRGKTVWCIQSIMNALLQISKKSDMLTSKLGVVFDPTKPLDFLEIMEKLNRRYGEGALSVMELKEIMDVFGLRGGRAVGILINRYERWRKTMDRTSEDFDGFAEKMRLEFEDTLPRQLARLGNEIKVAFIESFEGAEEALKNFVKAAVEGLERVRRAQETAEKLAEMRRTTGLIERAPPRAARGLRGMVLDAVVTALGGGGPVRALIAGALGEEVRRMGVTEGILETDKEIVKTAEKRKEIQEDALSTEIKLGFETERLLRAEEQRFNIQTMLLAGYEEEDVALQRIQDFMVNINAAAQADETTREHVVELNDLIGKSYEEQFALLAKIGGAPAKNLADFHKLWNNYLLAAQKLTADIAANLQTAVESGIEALLTGTKDWKEALQDIGKVMLKAQISEVGKALRATGIFKTVASGITQAHKTGGDYVKQSIISGYAEAAGAAGAVSRAGAAVPPAGGGGGIGGLFGGLFGGGQRMVKPPGQPAGWDPRMGTMQMKPAGAQFGTWQTGASTAIAGGLAGYAQTGTMGGAIGGVIGAGIGAFGGPAMAALGGMIGSMIGGLFTGAGPKEPSIERKEEDRTTRVESKLDMTNKQLEWVNRNLVALRVEMEPYPMPESAYFAERWGGRGGGASFGNIIIHVGTDAQGRDVADAFAERFIVHGNRILQ